MTVVVIDTVGDDLKAGKSFYDSCEIGVGDYFVESLLADLHSLKLYGGIHLRQFGFYRMLSKRFPFAIYYLKEQETIFVYAILDMRRNPSWLRAELLRRE